MLDQIDLDCAITKREYKQRLPELQARLYDMEQALLEAHIPVLIVFEGWAGTSKITTIGTLLRRLDPRGLRVYPITPPRTYETQYPWLHRFWLKTPEYGQIAIFDRSWYRQVLADRMHGKLDEPEWRSYCEDILSFERQLADDGTVILKFWLHISKKEQGRRFRKLLSDRLTAWQITEEDRWQNRHYRQVRVAVEDLLTRTDAPHAPWVVLPATDKRYTRIAVFETLLAALEARLGHVAALQSPQDDDEVFDGGGLALRRELAAVQVSGAAQHATTEDQLPSMPEDGCVTVEQSTVVAALPTPGILQRVDLQQKLDEETYDREIKRLQAKMHLLGFQVYLQKRPVILVFEGWDAAGKGGAIHRVTEKVDPRSYIVHTIAAPAGDDKAHHYLYRFWRRLPPRGAIAVFDRSWFGRVLVERVECFARPDEWQRAYTEINEFEHELVEFGTIICKFWLHISPEEQLRRFEERQNVPYKVWKITDEDWRNRDKWPQYEEAADEMLLRTSTPAAPWTIVEAEDKRFARIKVLDTIVQRLEDELGKVKL
jgi:polyphosphate kinase 2 (PPK2 family)